jgi:hypothetical protein
MFFIVASIVARRRYCPGHLVDMRDGTDAEAAARRSGQPLAYAVEPSSEGDYDIVPPPTSAMS